jgi:hypothetical protein
MCVLVNEKPDFQKGVFGTHDICKANCSTNNQTEEKSFRCVDNGRCILVKHKADFESG